MRATARRIVVLKAVHQATDEMMTPGGNGCLAAGDSDVRGRPGVLVVTDHAQPTPDGNLETPAGLPRDAAPFVLLAADPADGTLRMRERGAHTRANDHRRGPVARSGSQRSPQRDV